MVRAKLIVIAAFAAFALAACFSDEAEYSVAESKTIDASLFRQNCAICHGSNGDGKTLVDGTVVPSLRQGEFKKHTKTEIYNQIADGGNGMTPFRRQLSENELNLLADLVADKLRKQK